MNYASHATCGVCQPNVCTAVTTIRKLLQYSNELRKIVAILARIMATQVARDRRAIETAPSAKYLWLASQMLFIVESHDVAIEVQKKMTTLAPEFEGGMWVTRGRLKKGLPKILGVEKLPILLSSSRLAELIMIEAHQENHDSAPGTLARSRTRAWIHRGRYLARKVEARCVYYRAANMYLHNLTQMWWKLRMEQGFPTLLPYYRYKDTKRHENLQVDDVCLIK